MDFNVSSVRIFFIANDKRIVFPSIAFTLASACSMSFRFAGLEKSVSGSFLKGLIGIAPVLSDKILE